MTDRKGTPCQTFTGRSFYPLDPCAEDVCIEDIAHHLSMLCRWSGACSKFISVAEHSVRVSWLVGGNPGGPARQLQGLLHDGAEAYLGDMISPLKRHMPEYQAAEAAVFKCIANRFGIADTLDPRVVEADLTMLATEAHWFMGAPIVINGRHWTASLPAPMDRFEPWSQAGAKVAFEEMFREYTAAIASGA